MLMRVRVEVEPSSGRLSPGEILSVAKELTFAPARRAILPLAHRVSGGLGPNKTNEPRRSGTRKKAGDG
jgi:hypothetical protein